MCVFIFIMTCTYFKTVLSTHLQSHYQKGRCSESPHKRQQKAV